MPFAMTCPECDAQMAVPDAIAGKTIRCKACGETFKANPPATKSGPSARPRDDDEPRSRRSRPRDDKDDPPRRRDDNERPRSGRRRQGDDDETRRPGRPGRGRRPRVLGLVGLFVLLTAGGVAAYLIFFRSSPTDYTDPDGMYTARFPDTPEYKATGDPVRRIERVATAKAGGLEYTINVLGPVGSAKKLPGPELRDHLLKEWAFITAQNSGGESISEEPVDHQGLRGLDAILRYQSQGRAMFVRLLVTDKHLLRMMVAGPMAEGDQAKVLRERALAFFETVQVTPALGQPLDREPETIPATELGAEYQRDPKAADARFNGKWLYIVGVINGVSLDGDVAWMKAGDHVLEVKGGVAELKTGDTVTMIGLCGGLRPPGRDAPRIVFTHCRVVANPKR